MAPTSTLSTAIDKRLRKSLVAHCRKHGLKIQSFVENAIREQLEDELDMQVSDDRMNEPNIPLSVVMKKLSKQRG